MTGKHHNLQCTERPGVVPGLRMGPQQLLLFLLCLSYKGDMTCVAYRKNQQHANQLFTLTNIIMFFIHKFLWTIKYSKKGNNLNNTVQMLLKEYYR